MSAPLTFYAKLEGASIYLIDIDQHGRQERRRQEQQKQNDLNAVCPRLRQRVAVTTSMTTMTTMTSTNTTNMTKNNMSSENAINVWDSDWKSTRTN